MSVPIPMEGICSCTQTTINDIVHDSEDMILYMTVRKHAEKYSQRRKKGRRLIIMLVLVNMQEKLHHVLQFSTRRYACSSVIPITIHSKFPVRIIHTHIHLSLSL